MVKDLSFLPVIQGKNNSIYIILNKFKRTAMEENKVLTEAEDTKKYQPPLIKEQKELEIELFSDEPDPWGCGP